MSIKLSVYLLSLIFLVNIKEKKLEFFKNFIFICFIIILPALVNNTKINFELGNDIYVYREFYLSHQSGSAAYHGDFLFDYVSKVMSQLNIHVSYFFLLISVLQVYLVYKFAKKYSVNWKFSFFLYLMLFYFPLNFNILRQGLALSFSLFFVDSIIQKKNIRSVSLFIVMIMIHRSSVILGLLFLLPYIKIIKLDYWKIFLSFLIGFLGGPKFNAFMIKIFGVIAPNQFKSYFIANNFFTAYRLTISYAFYLVFLGALVLILIKISKSYSLSEYDIVFLTLNYIGYIILLLLFSMIIFRRLSDYFLIYTIINIPNIYNKSRYRQVLKFIVLILVSFRFLI